MNTTPEEKKMQASSDKDSGVGDVKKALSTMDAAHRLALQKGADLTVKWPQLKAYDDAVQMCLTTQRALILALFRHNLELQQHIAQLANDMTRHAKTLVEMHKKAETREERNIKQMLNNLEHNIGLARVLDALHEEVNSLRPLLAPPPSPTGSNTIVDLTTTEKENASELVD